MFCIRSGADSARAVAEKQSSTTVRRVCEKPTNTKPKLMISRSGMQFSWKFENFHENPTFHVKLNFKREKFFSCANHDFLQKSLPK